MFTLEQIRAAHAKVKSGADFPAYIREIKALGVRSYITFVSDGHTEFRGDANESLVWPPKYDALTIADHYSREPFENDLKAHQQGRSDYLTFSAQAAAHGVARWEMDLDKMTCTYVSADGAVVLVEGVAV